MSAKQGEPLERAVKVRRPRPKKMVARPTAAHEVWSMDFRFERTAEGCVRRRLEVVDHATHEAVVFELDGAICGMDVTSLLDRLALSRRLPKMIRTDYAMEFCSKAVVTWAHERGVSMQRLAPGKPRRIHGEMPTEIIMKA